MFQKISFITILAAIFAFGSMAGCGKKKKKKHKKHYKIKKSKKSKNKCKKLYKKIIEKTDYTKKDIKSVFGDKQGFIAACKANKDSKPWKKIFKCCKKDKKLRKCAKKQLKILLKKKIKKDKIKKNKDKKDKDKKDKKTFKDPKNLGEIIFKAAKKDDFDAVKKIFVTEDDVKDFNNGKLFEKYANKKKLKSMFEKYSKLFKGGDLKKVKKDSEKMVIKPGSKEKKFVELGAAIKKDVKIWAWKLKVEGKDKKDVKCSFVVIKISDENWKLLRLKGCKKK